MSPCRPPKLPIISDHRFSSVNKDSPPSSSETGDHPRHSMAAALVLTAATTITSSVITTLVILLCALPPGSARVLTTSTTTVVECPRIITRAEWGARPPTDIQDMETPVPYVVLHHTVMGEGECGTRAECIRVMQEIQDLHMDTNGWADIGYSFLIGGDGGVYEGRGWNRVGAHAPGYNDKSVGISVIGNFMEHLPNDLQLSVTQSLIKCAVEELGIVKANYTLLGHRDGSDTECPGNKLYEEISSWPQFHYDFQNPERNPMENPA